MVRPYTFFRPKAEKRGRQSVITDWWPLFVFSRSEKTPGPRSDTPKTGFLVFFPARSAGPQSTPPLLAKKTPVAGSPTPLRGALFGLKGRKGCSASGVKNDPLTGRVARSANRLRRNLLAPLGAKSACRSGVVGVGSGAWPAAFSRRWRVSRVSTVGTSRTARKHSKHFGPAAGVCFAKWPFLGGFCQKGAERRGF